MLNAINKTIAEIPIATEVFKDCFGYHIWLDGDYDDYEYFMIELSENLPEGEEFTNNIVTDEKLLSYGKCHILIKSDLRKKNRKK